jgi:CrcB protein
VRLLLVCLAGALGCGTRYLVINWTQRALGESFPWGVFTVNVVGSFVIAAVSVFALTKTGLTEAARAAISAGFLGGLTTYSSFNQDTLAMLDKKAYATAAVYVAATLLACLLAGGLGTYAARRI